MKKILFICYGNLLRSQFAEAYYNEFTHSSDAFSAGVDSTTPDRFGGPTSEAIQVMNEEGIDISQKKAKVVTEEMVNQAERVVVLCEKMNTPLFVRNSEKAEFWKIDDPYDTSVENHRRIRDQVKEKVKSLV